MDELIEELREELHREMDGHNQRLKILGYGFGLKNSLFFAMIGA